jgi:hypothetical protein
VQKKANYLFRIKDNHRAVRREIAQQFAIKPFRSVTEHSKGHGHEEVRMLSAMAVPEHLAKWPGIEQIVEVETTLWRFGKKTHSLRRGICSTDKRDSPTSLMHLWRNH